MGIHILKCMLLNLKNNIFVLLLYYTHTILYLYLECENDVDINRIFCYMSSFLKL